MAINFLKRKAKPLEKKEEKKTQKTEDLQKIKSVEIQNVVNTVTEPIVASITITNNNLPEQETESIINISPKPDYKLCPRCGFVLNKRILSATVEYNCENCGNWNLCEPRR